MAALLWGPKDSQECELRPALFPAPQRACPSHPTLFLRPTVFFLMPAQEEDDQEKETKEKGHRNPSENIYVLCRQPWWSRGGGTGYQRHAPTETYCVPCMRWGTVMCTFIHQISLMLNSPETVTNPGSLVLKPPRTEHQPWRYQGPFSSPCCRKHTAGPCCSVPVTHRHRYCPLRVSACLLEEGSGDMGRRPELEREGSEPSQALARASLTAWTLACSP